MFPENGASEYMNIKALCEVEELKCSLKIKNERLIIYFKSGHICYINENYVITLTEFIDRFCYKQGEETTFAHIICLSIRFVGIDKQ